MSFRTYHDVTGADRSDLGGQVAAQRARVAARLAGVDRVVAVMSGKGGVGKSYVTAALARGLAAGEDGGRVGVLDADLAGPTVARMLEAPGPLRVDTGGVHPATGLGGVAVISMDHLLADGDPLRWRQPSTERFVGRCLLEAGALRELLADVVWGTLAWLLVDLPPGADRLEDLAGLVPGLAGAIVVTLPSDESLRAVRRAARAAREAGVRLLGVVENMSGYACGGCGTVGPLFPGDAGARLAGEFDLPLLARLPFRPDEDVSTGNMSNFSGLVSAVRAVSR